MTQTIEKYEYCARVQETRDTNGSLLYRKRWYINGHIDYEVNYKDGLRHGDCVCYYTNGNPSLLCSYFKDKLHGSWKLEEVEYKGKSY